MAFLKKANAVLVHPRISSGTWGGIRKVASSGSERNLGDQIKGILGQPLDSDKYLVSHCTIVASVDTDVVQGVKLGNVKVGSKTVNRKWADYYIKPQCSEFVNNNGDSWSRDVLKMAYPTFIGGHNFQEHVQVEELSKGRIVDAVARDIGNSLYIDILIATDRKHAQLIQSIESGEMSTLSMGCTTDFTICSQCGHFAVDETQLCDHVKYAKLNTFLDDSGQRRVVAELCGHREYKDNPDAPGGVRFIEASWVAVPAFPGAVMRNILSPSESLSDSAKKVLASAPTQWSNTAVLKAASVNISPYAMGKIAAGEFGDEEVPSEEAPTPAPAAPPAPFKDLEDSLYESLKERVKKRIEKDLEGTDQNGGSVTFRQDNVVKEGSQGVRNLYKNSIETVLRVASSKLKLLEGVVSVNRAYGVKVDKKVYRTAAKIGPIHKFPTPESYIAACRKYSGRDYSPAEIRVVVRVGTLLSRWESINNPPKSIPSD